MPMDYKATLQRAAEKFRTSAALAAAEGLIPYKSEKRPLDSLPLRWQQLVDRRFLARAHVAVLRCHRRRGFSP